MLYFISTVVNQNLTMLDTRLFPFFSFLKWTPDYFYSYSYQDLNMQDDETTLSEEEELAKEEANDPIDEVKSSPCLFLVDILFPLGRCRTT